MIAEVRGFGQVGRPCGVGPPALDELLGLAPLREDGIILRRLDERLEVEGVSAEEDPVEVPVGDAHGAASGRVEAHRLDGIIGRFDRFDDVAAVLAAGGIGEALDAIEGDLAGPDEGVGRVFDPGIFGKERLPGRPPGILAIRGEEAGEVLADEGPVVVAVEGLIKGLDELEAGLEDGRGTIGAPAPGFVLAEEGGDFLDRVGSVTKRRIPAASAALVFPAFDRSPGRSRSQVSFDWRGVQKAVSERRRAMR